MKTFDDCESKENFDSVSFCVLGWTKINLENIPKVIISSEQIINLKKVINNLNSCAEFFGQKNKNFTDFVAAFQYLLEVEWTNHLAKEIVDEIRYFVRSHASNKEWVKDFKPSRHEMSDLIWVAWQWDFMYWFTIINANWEEVFLKNWVSISENMVTQEKWDPERICSSGSLTVNDILSEWDAVLWNIDSYARKIETLTFKDFFDSNFHEYSWFIRNYLKLEKLKHKWNTNAHIIVSKIESFITKSSNSNLVHPKMRENIRWKEFTISPMEYDMWEMWHRWRKLLWFRVSLWDKEIICRNGYVVLTEENTK